LPFIRWTYGRILIDAPLVEQQTAPIICDH
jgi:hypothetical protein